jgi:hypothetical protein
MPYNSLDTCNLMWLRQQPSSSQNIYYATTPRDLRNSISARLSSIQIVAGAK